PGCSRSTRPLYFERSRGGAGQFEPAGGGGTGLSTKARKQHEGMAQAYQALSVDHQYVKHSLHETEENLRELVSVMPAAVYACDREGIITYYNRQAIEVWGRTPDLDGRPWSFLDSRRLYRVDGTLLR